MLASLRNSISSYFGSNKPPRHPSSKRSGGSRSRLTTLRSAESISSSSSPAPSTSGGVSHQLPDASSGADEDEVDYQPSSSSYAGSTTSGVGGGHHRHQHQPQILIRTREIRLVRDGGTNNDSGYGFTLRHVSGGNNKEGSKGRSFVVTQIRPDSPADRDGTVQVGDRLISVNGRDLSGCSLSQAQKWIRDTDKLTAVIEYDVAVVDRSQYAHSPLLVEVAVTTKSSCLSASNNNNSGTLGIHLCASTTSTGASGASAEHLHVKSRSSSAIFIESIAPASIAERCGALQPGDQLLAIGDTRLDCASPASSSGCDQLSVQEASRLLRSQTASSDVVQLIIAPAGLAGRSRSRQLLLSTTSSPRPSLGHNGTLRSRMSRATTHKSGSVVDNRSLASSSGSLPGRFRLGHSEWVSVTLQIDCRGSYGLALGRAPASANHSVPSPSASTADLPVNARLHQGIDPVVINVETASPCDRAGCIQPGDRILRINGQSTAGLDLDEVVSIMRDSKPRMTLDVEFDVVDSVVPASGLYWLKLVKPQGSVASYGITLQDGKLGKADDGGLTVVDVSPGSIAHRTGSVRAGDRLLAVHHLSGPGGSPSGSQYESMTGEELTMALNALPVVRLKLQKAVLAPCLPPGKSPSEEGPVTPPPVVYTVELVRHGGPLGITISGTENPDDPIVISGLTEGGLAERTGALHVGDRLLAINGRSLQGKLLSQAIEILKDSGDVVTLRIGKSNKMAGITVHHPKSTGELEPEDYLPLKMPALPSIDSAVESWISSGSGSAASSSSTNSNNDNNIINNNNNHHHGNKIGSDSAVIYTAESATVRRRQGTSSSPGSSTTDSGQFSGEVNVIVVNHNGTAGASPSTVPAETSTVTPRPVTREEPIVRMSDLALVRQHSMNSTLPRHFRHNNKPCPVQQSLRQSPSPIYCLSPVSHLPSNMEVHQVTLHKDSVYEDFGFSVSDGLYERGIYVNRIRKGGPADLSGALRAFDRILQVNDTRTYDFDCCLTVPLIAAAGDTISLLIGRNPHSVRIDLKEADGALEWPEEEQNDVDADEEEAIPADAEACAAFVGLRTITTTL